MSSLVKINVAIVEDDEEIAQEWERILLAYDKTYCVGSFRSAETAVGSILKTQPDVILMDIGLPKKNGIVFTRELRHKLPNTEILICTVFHDSDHILEALRAGAGGYILKSASNIELLNAVETIHNGGSPIDSQIARKIIHFFNPRQKLVDPLTKREIDILSLVAKGYRNKDIAEHLSISSETVRTHIRNIYLKLETNSRMAAVQKYYGTKFEG